MNTIYTHSLVRRVILTITMSSAVLLSIPFFALAQMANPIPVNIEGTTIVRPLDDSGTVGIAFDLVNMSDTPQAGLRYGVQLMQPKDTVETEIDTFVAEPVISLDGNQIKHIEINYTVPTMLTGEYDLFVVAKTSAGMMAGLGSAGKITLVAKDATNETQEDVGKVEIITNSCVFAMSSAPAPFAGGIEIEKGTDLTVRCDVQSHAATPLTLTPHFVTYAGSVYGNELPIKSPEQKTINFAPNEKKNIEFTVLTFGRAQRYEIKLLFIDGSGSAEKSNSVVGFYIVKGVGATIQSASLDKVSYKAGESIAANFLWSTTIPAGEFKGVFQLTVKDTADDAVCADSGDQTLTINSISVTATKDCLVPEARLMIFDADHHLLDAVVITTAAADPEMMAERIHDALVISTSTVEQTSSGSVSPVMKIAIAVTIFFLIVLGCIAWLLMRSKRNPDSGIIGMFFLLVVLTSGVFLPMGEAGALYCTTNCGTMPATDVYFSAWFDKTSVAPGETFTINTSYTNVSVASFTAKINVTFNGVTKTVLGPTVLNTGVTLTGTPTVFTAPATTGTYTVKIDTYRNSAHSTYYQDIYVRTNGVCGTANNSHTNIAPSGTAACSSSGGYTPNPITWDMDLSWAWTCNGSGPGAASASCHASAAYPILILNGVSTVTQENYNFLNLPAGQKLSLTWHTNSPLATSCKLVQDPGGIIQNLSGGWTGGSIDVTIPPVATVYYWIFCYYDDSLYSNWQYSVLQVTVAQSGTCGSSDGDTFATPPSTNLCSSGYTSAVLTKSTADNLPICTAAVGYPSSCTVISGTKLSCDYTEVVDDYWDCDCDCDWCYYPATAQCSSDTSAITYSWSCLGTGGGSTASCSATGLVNQTPTAFALTAPASDITVPLNTLVTFTGSGSDTDGTITGYRWNDGNCTTGTVLSTANSFSNATLSVGIHTIYFSVQDNTGAWSTNCPSRTVTVTAPVVVDGVCGTLRDSCTTGTFADVVDDATNSLWSCVGNNGGSTASCSHIKPTGTIGTTDTKLNGGGVTTILWSAANATECHVDQNGILWQLGLVGTGVLTPQLYQDTLFNLVCDGMLVSSVPIDITNIPKLTLSRRVVNIGDTVTIGWNTHNTNIATCALVGGKIVTNPITAIEGSTDINVYARTTYTLACDNPEGGAKLKDTITIEIVPKGYGS